MSIRPRYGDAPGPRLSTLQTINAFIFGSDLELQDRMGPPGKLDREHAYAVLASRSGTIVAFSFATLEGAQECARLGARTRRFIAEINYPVGTWNESSHAGDDATADERIREWLRKELEALKQ